MRHTFGHRRSKVKKARDFAVSQSSRMCVQGSVERRERRPSASKGQGGDLGEGVRATSQRDHEIFALLKSISGCCSMNLPGRCGGQQSQPTRPSGAGGAGQLARMHGCGAAGAGGGALLEHVLLAHLVGGRQPRSLLTLVEHHLLDLPRAEVGKGGGEGGGRGRG